MNKMRTLILILCLTGLFTNTSFAQESETYDVLTLKNGDLIKGQILELEKGDYVIIRVAETGEKTLFKLNEVANINQVDASEILEEDNYNKQTKKERVKPVYKFQEKGRFTSVNFGFSFGKRESTAIIFDPFFPNQEQKQNAIGFSIQGVVGHQFSHRLGLGIGASYDAYSLEDGESVITLLAHTRGYIGQRIIAPFWALNAGYGFALVNKDQGVEEAKGGLMFHPELGLRLGASDKTNFTLSLGYRFQSAEYIQEFPFNGDIEYRNVNYRRFLFSIGLLF